MEKPPAQCPVCAAVSSVQLGAGDGVSVYLCVACQDEFTLVDEASR